MIVGTVASAPVVPMVVQAAQELGVKVGPATASLGATLLAGLFAYLARGGRKGEAD